MLHNYENTNKIEMKCKNPVLKNNTTNCAIKRLGAINLNFKFVMFEIEMSGLKKKIFLVIFWNSKFFFFFFLNEYSFN